MSCLSENLYMCIYMYMYILNNVIHVILLSYHTIIYVHIHVYTCIYIHVCTCKRNIISCSLQFETSKQQNTHTWFHTVWNEFHKLSFK